MSLHRDLLVERWVATAEGPMLPVDVATIGSLGDRVGFWACP